MGLFNFFKKVNKESVSSDWTNEFPKDIVERLLAEIKENKQATSENFIKEGFGEFGLEKTNPIPAFGIPSNDKYLKLLRSNNDEILSYRRTGSILVENISKKVDEYEVFNLKGDTIAFIYISPYHWKTSQQAPVGFYLKGSKRETFVPLQHPRENFIPRSAYEEFQELQKVKEREKVRVERKKNIDNEVSIYRDNSEEFIEILNHYGIAKLYHFTDKNNLPSIIENKGLFSWFYCLEKGIDIINPGGNELSRELDHRKNLHNYVRVSLTRNHPMMFAEHNRFKEIVILEIEAKVIYLKGTKFSDKNAARNDALIGEDLAGFKNIKFDLFRHPNHFNLSEDDKPFYQGEILINECVALEYILNINELVNP
jgi:hypothetical protein